MSEDLKRGQQIAYVPDHADGNLGHRDVEFGFVTSVKGDTVFCRYWSRYTPNELRTKANSEGADRRLIVPHVSHDQAMVDNAFEEYEIP